jgi:apolipoprotein N-acyltransferase
MSRLGSQRLREVVFLVVGATTPIGILAVNGSAFVMQHLDKFTIGIAACALISGLSLNGLTAWAALDRAERFAPRLTEYRGWLVAATVAFVIVFSALGAYWTYESMHDSRRLPNTYAVLTALWLLFLPVLMTLVARRLKVRAGVRGEESAGRAGVAVPFESAPGDRR